MLNDAMGTEAFRDGSPGLEVPAGQTGCVLYGPYQTAPAEHLRVSFRIVPLVPVTDDVVVAFVDVVGESGQRFHAADFILASELSGKTIFTLDAVVQAGVPLEYRVHSTGAIPLFVADHPLVVPVDEDMVVPGRMTGAGEDLLGAALEHDLRLEDLLPNCGPPPATDEAILGRALRAAWEPFAPRSVRGFAKERIGSTRDGGYVCVSDLDGIDTVLSFGINDNVDFDLDMADRGITIQQYDHTVEDPRPNDPRMAFHKTMIGVARTATSESLPDLVKAFDRGAERSNIFLKIDIENWEWSVFDAISLGDLSRIRQITGEFHAFEFFRYPVWRARMQRVLAKLAKNFALVHVHANNYAGTTNIDGIVLPNVLEMTFVNRDCYHTEISREIFPTKLDMACDPSRPDYPLGMFTFGEPSLA